eukprot:Nk52_evm34s156 gene=Nk52_evmTU34s156
MTTSARASCDVGPLGPENGGDSKGVEEIAEEQVEDSNGQKLCEHLTDQNKCFVCNNGYVLLEAKDEARNELSPLGLLGKRRVSNTLYSDRRGSKEHRKNSLAPSDASSRRCSSEASSASSRRFSLFNIFNNDDQQPTLCGVCNGVVEDVPSSAGAASSTQQQIQGSYSCVCKRNSATYSYLVDIEKNDLIDPDVNPLLMEKISKSIESMHNGAVFFMWNESKSNGQMYMLKLDKFNHIITWTKKHMLFESSTIDGSLEVVDLKELRFNQLPSAKHLKKYKKFNVDFSPELSITIVHGKHALDTQFINLIAPSSEVCNQWVQGLYVLLSAAQERSTHDTSSLWLRKQYLKMCKKGKDDKIYIKNVLDLLGKEKKPDIKVFLRSVGVDTSKKLMGRNIFDFKNFCKLYYEVNPRKDISELFAKIAGGKNCFMSIPILRTFLRQQQKIQNVTEALCKDIIQTFEREPKLVNEGYLSLKGFKEFLLSVDNHIYNYDYLAEFQPMDLPLSNYYINSSHNTYLTGHQLRGESSVEMYIKILLDGCRCVELDCWDGDDGEPIIYHGHTLTTKIKFADVIIAVAKYSFVTSPYPVILSFENHCSIAQQIRMADICKKEFGEMLVTEFLFSEEHPINLPSPEELRYRIIIKNKKRDIDQGLGKRSSVSLSQDGNLFSSEPSLSMSPRVSTIEEGERRVSSMTTLEQSPRRNSTDKNTSPTSADSKGREVAFAVSSPSSNDYSLRKAIHTPSGMSTASETGTCESLDEDKPHGNAVASRTPSDQIDRIRATSLKKRYTMDADEVRHACNPVIKQSRRPTMKRDEINTQLRRGSFRGRNPHFLSSRTKFFDFTAESQPTEVNEFDWDQFQKVEHSKSGKNIAQELSDLVNYCHSVPFQNFEYHAMRKRCCEMCSFSEGRVEKYMKKDATQIVNFCKTQILRVFPNGKRIESSNFNPQMCWNHGIQMATLNFQTPDIPMQLNYAKFEQNGKCGYVLKPSVMRRQMKFDPNITEPIELVEPYKLTLTVISGQQLSLGKCSPHVEIEIFGLPADSRKFRTKTVHNNSVDPEWHEVFTTQVLLVENAMIRFAVLNDNGNLLGQFTMPVEAISQGYRHVPLRTAFNEQIPLRTIFVHVKLEEVVPEKHVDLLDLLMKPQKLKGDAHQHSGIVKALCFPGEEQGN